MEILKSLFGYWEVWHVVLAGWLWAILYFQRFPANYYFKLLGRRPTKQICSFTVLGVALLYELIEPTWNLSAYPSARALLLNSFKDMASAALSVVVGIILFKDRSYDS